MALHRHYTGGVEEMNSMHDVMDICAHQGAGRRAAPEVLWSATPCRRFR